MLSSEMIETISLKSEMILGYSCLPHFSSLNLVSVVVQSIIRDRTTRETIAHRGVYQFEWVQVLAGSSYFQCSWKWA